MYALGTQTHIQYSVTNLYVLALCFVIEYVRYLLSKDLLAAGSGVDTNHGDSNGPGGVAYGHLQVGVISLGGSFERMLRCLMPLTLTYSLASMKLHILAKNTRMSRRVFWRGGEGRGGEGGGGRGGKSRHVIYSHTHTHTH